MKPLCALLISALALAAAPALAQPPPPQPLPPGGPGGMPKAIQPPGAPGGPFIPGGPKGGGPGPIGIGKKGLPPATGPKVYRSFPVEGNLSTLLQEDLLEAKGVQDILDSIKGDNDPAAKEILDAVRAGKLNDPAIRDKLREYVRKKPGLLNMDPEQVKAIQRALEKRREEAAAAPPPDPRKTEQAAGASAPPAPPPPLPESEDVSGGPVQKFVRDLAELLQKPSNAKLREKLSKSPAVTHWLQEALAKKRGDGSGAGSGSGGGGNGDSGLPGLPDASQFQLPGSGNGSAEPLVPGLGGVGGPAGGEVAVQGLLALLAAGIIAAVLWKLLAARSGAAPSTALAGLGPWPVEPERVATREQLVQAFEYLAVLLLGESARTANHRDIAASLDGTPDRGRAAGELAELYETARYDPAGDLPPPALAAARRDLCLLAGRAAALPGDS
jgi:hypothetical protein